MFVLSSFSCFFSIFKCVSIGSQVLRSVCFQHLENKHVHFIHVFDMKAWCYMMSHVFYKFFPYVCSCVHVFLHDLVKHYNLYDTHPARAH